MVDGGLNLNFPQEYEDWFKDNLGFRSKLINWNGSQLYHVFNQFPDSSETKLGRAGDLNYAPDFIIADYQRINVWSDEEADYIAQSYQVINDMVESTGAKFYYVQCVDKHTICPEQFLSGLYQLGNVSKTDKVMAALDKTSVKHLYMKEAMLENKDKNVYGHWNDSTHWTQRGSFIGYGKLMEMLNADLGGTLKVLDESDFNIEKKDLGTSMYGIHKEDMLETFELKAPKAQLQEDKSEMSGFAEDDRHLIWKNPEAGNGLKLLVMGDSYFENVNKYLAESFSEVWLIWGDYTAYLREAVGLYQPDVVIYQAAERVDRSGNIVELANSIMQPQEQSQ